MEKIEIERPAREKSLIVERECLCEVKAWYGEDKEILTIQHGRPEALLNILGEDLIEKKYRKVQIKYDKWVKEVHKYWDECEEKTLNYEEYYKKLRMRSAKTEDAKM